jgi:hypothetical protein
MTEWLDSPGHMPKEAAGKRVAVILRNGMICGEKPISPSSPAGWPADGWGACIWKIDGHPFDILRYRIL